MRIVLIHFRENYTPALPMGILYIGTVLKNNGYEVKVIDSFPAYNDETLKEVRYFYPNLIGLSVLTTGFGMASYYTPILRRQNPNALLCWGGVHPTSLPEEVLAKQEIDFVVAGEGEQTMLEACHNLNTGKGLEGIKGIIFKRDNKIINNGEREFITNLDDLPIPDRKLLKTPTFSWYLSPPGIIRGQFLEGITTFHTSRGCPFNCIFCCSHQTAGRKLRQRSIANVTEEIGHLVYDFNIKGLFFSDDTFCFIKEYVTDLCQSIRKSKFKLVWGCQTRADLVDKDILHEMKSAGCIQVDIGCESGSDKVLKNLKKGIEVKDILRAFQTAKDIGIDTFATFVIGNPGETMEDIHKTQEVARKINSRVSFLILVPYPGSELFGMAKKNNWFIDKELYFSTDWANKQSESPVMEINFKSAELLHIRAKLQNSYFWKNNIKIFMFLLSKPTYFSKIIFTCFRNLEEILKIFLLSIMQRKTSILLEAVYQKYNEELMKFKMG